MLTTRYRQAIALLPALVLGISPSLAEVKQAPVRTVQIDSHGRYPFGQFRGGYRYPFSYPYYRYGGPRHYPYSSRLYPFGVGPYGPYGSNYGGYSGNAYDPQVYGRPSPAEPSFGPSAGPAMPDAPPAPPAADDAGPRKIAPPANAAPSADSAPRSAQPQENSVKAESGSGPTVNVFPVPEMLPALRGPVGYFGGYPTSGGFGLPYTYGVNPFGYFGNTFYFGTPFFGFGMAPPQPYYYFDGPPSVSGYFNPQLAPPVYNLNGRNYGPAYRTPGGVNLGPAHYDGF